jgi:hypothetical protein
MSRSPSVPLPVVALATSCVFGQSAYRFWTAQATIQSTSFAFIRFQPLCGALRPKHRWLTHQDSLFDFPSSQCIHSIHHATFLRSSGDENVRPESDLLFSTTFSRGFISSLMLSHAFPTLSLILRTISIAFLEPRRKFGPQSVV